MKIMKHVEKSDFLRIYQNLYHIHCYLKRELWRSLSIFNFQNRLERHRSRREVKSRTKTGRMTTIGMTMTAVQPQRPRYVQWGMFKIGGDGIRTQMRECGDESGGRTMGWWW